MEKFLDWVEKFWTNNQMPIIIVALVIIVSDILILIISLLSSKERKNSKKRKNQYTFNSNFNKYSKEPILKSLAPIIGQEKNKDILEKNEEKTFFVPTTPRVIKDETKDSEFLDNLKDTKKEIENTSTKLMIIEDTTPNKVVTKKPKTITKKPVVKVTKHVETKQEVVTQPQSFKEYADEFNIIIKKPKSIRTFSTKKEVDFEVERQKNNKKNQTNIGKFSQELDIAIGEINAIKKPKK